jgi:uncharacterized protein
MQIKKNIKIKVLPRSSKNQIIKISENNFKIKITSAPVDGEANKQVIKFLSKEWKISKSNIKIIKGETSQNKILEILE